jgi:hypothetical protein
MSNSPPRIDIGHQLPLLASPVFREYYKGTITFRIFFRFTARRRIVGPLS